MNSRARLNMIPPGPEDPAPLAKLSPVVQWILLLVSSALIASLLEVAGMPAALLLGPMLAGILIRINGGTIRVPPLSYYGSQAILGCLIASLITRDGVIVFLTQWPLFLGTVLAIIAVTTLLGWLMSRRGMLPGTIAIWGLSPGAAAAMVLMAEAFGEDARLVAFMQYVRVAFVAVVASVISRTWLEAPGTTALGIIWFPSIHAFPFAETVAIAVIGGFVGRVLRIPAGMMLVPMIAGAVLQAGGMLVLEMPQWLLAVSFAVLGWHIGYGFTRAICLHAFRALPQIMLAILVLLCFCGGLAFVLVKAAGMDPLTAFLATAPGGMDVVAVIAASSKADISLVMAFQTVRFVVVLIVVPPLTRFIVRRMRARAPGGDAP
jgi:membrane AbrB-like protein